MKQEAGSNIGPRFFLCVPSFWSHVVLSHTQLRSDCRHRFLILRRALHNIWLTLSHAQRLQSAALMFQTLRIKLIEVIFVSWKDVRPRCLSLLSRPFSSSVPNSSLVVRLYAEARCIDFFEISRNFAAAPRNCCLVRVAQLPGNSKATAAIGVEKLHANLSLSL